MGVGDAAKWRFLLVDGSSVALQVGVRDVVRPWVANLVQDLVAVPDRTLDRAVDRGTRTGWRQGANGIVTRTHQDAPPQGIVPVLLKRPRGVCRIFVDDSTRHAIEHAQPLVRPVVHASSSVDVIRAGRLTVEGARAKIGAVLPLDPCVTVSRWVVAAAVDAGERASW